MKQKKLIAKVLKSMKLGSMEEYPLVRILSVKTTIERVQQTTKKKFSTHINGNIFEVTRVS